MRTGVEATGVSLWPRDGAAGVAGFDVRAGSAIAFLLSSGALIFGSAPVPGYVRPSWMPVFLAIGVVCVVLAGLTLALGYLSGARAVMITLFADGAIVIAVASLADRQGGQIVGSLMALPTLFIAIFMTGRWLLAQAGLVIGCGWVIVGLTGAEPVVHLVRVLVLLISSAGPACIVLLLRLQLDRALDLATELATTDPLTGLLNRRGMEERFPALLAHARRAGTPVAAVVADIDRFKQVNDRYGHATGDEVLRLVAATAAGCARGDDLVVRLGGEEIVVVAVADEAGAIDLAERLRATVEASGTDVRVTVSAGVATTDVTGLDGADPVDVLRSVVDRADEFMYEAKRAGRNLVRGAAAPAAEV